MSRKQPSPLPPDVNRPAPPPAPPSKGRAQSSLVDTLQSAAELLELEAAALFECNTYRGAWTQPDHGAKAEHDTMVEVIRQLRRAAEYARPNPLGGPAVVFEACANAIRAGDDIDQAMVNYGLAWARKKGPR